MSDISALIEVFRMTELKPETRVKVIIKMGRAINDTYADNVTEPIIYELVTILEPDNPILKDDDFIRRAGVKL